VVAARDCRPLFPQKKEILKLRFTTLFFVLYFVCHIYLLKFGL